MTCAKFRVTATLIGASGRTYFGENVCRNPQTTCPREPWEDYEKCRTICDQVSHAEIAALKLAGGDAVGGTMKVGYHYACTDCALAMQAHGVASVTFKR